MAPAAIYGTTPLAGAFSGLIAYRVEKNLQNALGHIAWEWLFIIEGSASIIFALIVVALLPALPDTVAEKGSLFFRHENERKLIALRMAAGMPAVLENILGCRAV